VPSPCDFSRTASPKARQRTSHTGSPSPSTITLALASGSVRKQWQDLTGLGDLSGLKSLRQDKPGIDKAAVLTDFEVQVGAL
jgi:hypothetical protein